MNNKQLFIAEQLVDLSADTVIAITKQIHDIGDISTRNSDRSNKFKIPKTATNQAIFGVSDRVQSGSAKPYRQSDCKFIDNGVEIVPNGFAVIDEADEFYSVTIYSGNLDFFSVIAELKLSDLDLSELNHLWSLTAIDDSRTNVTGYKYSFIDYGAFAEGSRDINCSDLRPSIFFSTILDKIFTEAGFTYSGDIFSEDKFTKLLLPFITNDEDAVYYNTDSDLTTGNWKNLGLSLTVTDPDAYLTAQAVEEWGFEIVVRYEIVDWTIGNSVFGMGMAETTSGAWDFFVSHTDGQGDGEWSVDTTGIYATYTGSLTDHFLYINVKDCKVRIIGGEITGTEHSGTGKTFFAHIKPSQLYDLTAVAFEYNFAAGLDMLPQLDFSTWDFNRFLPDMSQTEFIKAIANMFCLFVETDEHTKDVSFTTFETISDNRSVAKDWSDKLDMNSSKIAFRIGNYGQKNYFKYSVDSNDTDVTEGFADHYFSIDDETLPNEVTVVELPFAATKMTTKLMGLKVPLIRKIDEDGNFAIDTFPRVLYDNTSDITGDNIILNDTTNLTSASPFITNVPLAYFIDEGKVNNLGFANSLLENYSDFEQLFNRMKVVTAKLNLNLVDVVTFSHFIPVFLEQHAAFFYVNKISNFKANELTTVELIRL